MKGYPHIKRTVAKGKAYYYYRTGVKSSHGKELLTPLPDIRDPGFGRSYASCLAGRSRRESAAAELTVTDLVTLYRKSPKFLDLSAGSQRLYGFGLDHLTKKLPTAPAGLVERSDVALLIDERAHTPGAANSLLRTINALYKWARERGHVSNDPGRDIPELEGGEHEPWPERVLEAALKAKDDRVRLAVHLLLYTAQRIGDVVNMKWTDIKDGSVTVVPQKTIRHKKKLTIPLHESLSAELARHQRGLGYIIPGGGLSRRRAEVVRGELQAFAAKHGAKVVPHGLRKNAVNALLEAGCSAAETAAISGQSMQMVEHYAKGRSQSGLASAAILKWNRK